MRNTIEWNLAKRQVFFLSLSALRLGKIRQWLSATCEDIQFSFGYALILYAFRECSWVDMLQFSDIFTFKFGILICFGSWVLVSATYENVRLMVDWFKSNDSWRNWKSDPLNTSNPSTFFLDKAEYECPTLCLHTLRLPCTEVYPCQEKPHLFFNIT